MADDPPDEDLPNSAEDRLLSQLLDRLERALDMAAKADVMNRLDEIGRLCEEAAALCQQGPV